MCWSWQNSYQSGEWIKSLSHLIVFIQSLSLICLQSCMHPLIVFNRILEQNDTPQTSWPSRRRVDSQSSNEYSRTHSLFFFRFCRTPTCCTQRAHVVSLHTRSHWRKHIQIFIRMDVVDCSYSNSFELKWFSLIWISAQFALLNEFSFIRREEKAYNVYQNMGTPSLASQPSP